MTMSDLRLVGGSGPHEGRVEVFHAGEWGTVCHSGWSLEDAHVACRQLGYPEAVRETYSAHFGQGTGRIWLDTLGCTGTEERLTDCKHGGWGRVPWCRHIHDSGVVCKTAAAASLDEDDDDLI
ncbi:PREDICTED: scavenger receptor class A member 5-like [Branchiostoma belcheri]|uniref:Scavenger receptor class A member 5-like n=1 Tax=Branchiostoma belcheri TaxID=7741 RepID=A0A6P4ZFM8_BRABE|nr:PREDICTED: scavenger receptor class A member 5-like [Branchiostoma belcheri]